MHSPVRAIFTVLTLLFTTLPGSAQWRDIGSMPVPQQSGAGVEFRNDTAVAQIQAITPDIVRVRIAPGPALGRDHSYAVIAADTPPPAPAIRTADGRTMLETAAVRVVLQHAPFRVSFEDPGGQSLDSDDPERGIAFAGPSVRVWKRLRDDEQVYGLGEKTGRLNKRGRKLGGYSYAMWNSDTYAYGPDTMRPSRSTLCSARGARTASSSTTRFAAALTCRRRAPSRCRTASLRGRCPRSSARQRSMRSTSPSSDSFHPTWPSRSVTSATAGAGCLPVTVLP